MKNKFKLGCALLVASVGLLACSDSNETKAGLKSDFTKIYENKGFNTQVHNATGCHFTVSNGSYPYGNVTQILGADGLPYCPQNK